MTTPRCPHGINVRYCFECHSPKPAPEPPGFNFGRKVRVTPLPTKRDAPSCPECGFDHAGAFECLRPEPKPAEPAECEKCARLEKQVGIAIEALNLYRTLVIEERSGAMSRLGKTAEHALELMGALNTSKPAADQRPALREFWLYRYWHCGEEEFSVSSVKNESPDVIHVREVKK